MRSLQSLDSSEDLPVYQPRRPDPVRRVPQVVAPPPPVVVPPAQPPVVPPVVVHIHHPPPEPVVKRSKYRDPNEPKPWWVGWTGVKFAIFVGLLVAGAVWAYFTFVRGQL
jgi:hypothetical protein